jgi:toxin ParE1/3/4
MTEKIFQVEWTETAAKDLEEIVSYLAADSLINAEILLGKLKKKAESLETVPLRGRIVPELAYFGIQTWRELLVKPYRIMYRVAERQVYVLAIFDGRRDLGDVLLERLVRNT